MKAKSIPSPKTFFYPCTHEKNNFTEKSGAHVCLWSSSFTSKWQFSFHYSSFFSFQTDEDRPQSFVQSFVLKPANDSFFIQHDMFRLVIHNVAAN